MRICSFLLGLPARVLAGTLLFLAWTAVPAGAQGGLYSVGGIQVDATDENAASAREAAHASGHLAAFEILIARLVPEDDVFAVPQLEAAEIGALVQDFSVDNERTSAVRYLATLNFRFNPDSVRTFLGQNEIPFAEIRSEPTLVLPIVTDKGQTLLWRQPNPWRSAWQGMQLDAELVPMVLPLGDLEDISAITASQALRGDAGGLQTLARRYGVASIYVARLTIGFDPDTSLSTGTLDLWRFGGIQASTTVRQSHLQQDEESRGAFIRRIARAAANEITEGWKQENLLRLAEQSSIMVTVPVADLGQWLQVKARLDQVVTVVDSELSHMTRGSVDLLITYIGDQNQLTRALAQQQLSLTQDLNEGWWQLGLAVQ